MKRVAGGRVSNWLLDEVAAGDILALTRPAGVFTLRPHSTPIVAFSGGSGSPPSSRSSRARRRRTERPVRLLYANRDVDSVIFRAGLDVLQREHPDRLEVEYHLDVEHGFVHSNGVAEFVGADLAADFYLCGPVPFMDVVEDALAQIDVATEQVFVERFAFASSARLDEPPATPAADAGSEAATETVVIVLDGREHPVHYHAGETFLETARRAGLHVPFSCESGSCATCMARLQEGEATMRVNNALTPDEVDEGWASTCQGLPCRRP